MKTTLLTASILKSHNRSKLSQRIVGLVHRKLQMLKEVKDIHCA